MKIHYMIGTVIVSFSILTGCMTMDGLKETKKEYSEGNVIAGTWMGLMSLSILPIVDVFTLGGALDAEQSNELWTGAATQYANNQQQLQDIKNKQLQAQQAALLKAQQQQALLRTQQQYSSASNQGNYNVSQNSSYSNNSNNNNTNISSSSSNKSTASAKTDYPVKCVSTSYNSDGSMRLFNGCSKDVNIAFCYTQVTTGANREKYKCHPQNSHWASGGVNYATQWPGAIKPGQSMNIAWDPQKRPYRLTWVGCSSPFTIPIIESVRTDGSSTVYCRNPNVN